MRLWMVSTATLGGALVMGMALGSYATGGPAVPFPSVPVEQALADEPADAAGQDAVPSPVYMAQGPDEPIHCTGCGPTLAERRWRTDMAAIDMNDRPPPEEEWHDAPLPQQEEVASAEMAQEPPAPRLVATLQGVAARRIVEPPAWLGAPQADRPEEASRPD